MALIDPVKKFFLRQKANPVGTAISDPWTEEWGRLATGISTDTASYYKASVAVYACVKIRADNIAKPPLVVYKMTPKGDEPVGDEHPFQQLLDRVNPFWSRGKLWRATETALLLWGSAFWALERFGRPGPPKELWWIRPDRVRVLSDSEQYIKGYFYQPQGAAEGITFKPDEVIWIPFFNPYDEYSGLSPLEAARLSVEANAEAMKWNRRFFDNDASPGRTVLQVKEAMAKDQVEELQARWAKAHRGPDKAHKLAVVTGGGELKSLGIPHRDMEFLGMQRFTLEDVCRIYRVPPPLVADLEKATYSNIREAKMSFWHETVLPELQMLEETINEFLVPMFGQDLFVKFDLTGIEALHEEETQKADRYQKLVSTGILTINEVREREGLEPVSWGNTWWAPLNLLPAASGGGSQKEEALHSGWMEVKGNGHAPLFFTPREGALMEGFQKRLDSQERGIARAFREFFSKQEESVLAKFRQAGKQPGRPDLLDEAEWAEKLRVVVAPLVASVLKTEAEAAIAEHGLAISFDLANPRVRQWLGDRVKKFSKDVNQTTARAIAGTLQDGHALGESVPKLTERIQHVFTQARTYRAERIARTEVVSASNRGAHEAYVQSGVVDRKMWLTSIDGRERPEHAEAHRQTVPLGDPFVVGGETIMHPGEGSPGNSINCRCTEVPVIGRQTRCVHCNNLLGYDLVAGWVDCDRCHARNTFVGAL